MMLLMDLEIAECFSSGCFSISALTYLPVLVHVQVLKNGDLIQGQITILMVVG